MSILKSWDGSMRTRNVKPPSLVSVLLSPIISHFATQSARKMIQWMEAIDRRMGVFSLWGFPEALERLHSGTANMSPQEIEEAKLKREAEKKVDESGQGECSFCKEEIVKNERGFWESDTLLEYCTEARDHRHKPKIVWKTNESV